MTTFKSIVAATDFSIDGNNAVRRAALLARQHGASLTILHVVDEAASRPLREWFSPAPDIKTRVAQAHVTLHRLAREEFDPNGDLPTLDVHTGDTVEVLSNAAQDADLLVLGQRARNPLQDLLLGHTAHRLAARSHRPVLVVKEAVQAPYRRTLVSFDFTPSSDAAALVAASAARDADLQFFHAFRPGREVLLRRAGVAANVIRETRALESDGLVARMRRRIARLGLDSRSMSFAVGHGPCTPTILNQQQTRRADLMVAGRQRRSKLFGALTDSISIRLLKESRCDTLIVPHQLSDPLPSRRHAAQHPTGRNANIDITRLPGSTAAFVQAPGSSWMRSATTPTAANRDPRSVGK